MTGRTRRRTERLAAAALAIPALVAPLAAQAPEPPAQVTEPPAATAGLLTRYDFHLGAASLASSDERFSWDAHFGGDLDLIDYGAGRASVLVDYEAVLGNEFRAFDPNQGNYTLETSASARLGRVEAAFVFHHVSRHLSDRPKRFPIAWNAGGGRILRRLSVGDTAVDLDLDAGGILQHSYVDYTWVAQLDVLVRRPLASHAVLFVHGNGQLVGVDSSVAQRGTQRGGLLEGGVRLSGRGAAIELFAGAERRIDADPIDRQAQQWGLAGFRLVSR
jgi:hypothetical protein